MFVSFSISYKFDVLYDALFWPRFQASLDDNINVENPRGDDLMIRIGNSSSIDQSLEDFLEG